MTKALLAAWLGILCGGCVGTADSISVIRGQLVLADGSELSGCTVVPYLSGSGERLSRYEREVDSRFFVSLVNAPRSGMAILEFRCPNVSGTVRSREFRLAEASEPNGVDIGRVVVTK